MIDSTGAKTLTASYNSDADFEPSTSQTVVTQGVRRALPVANITMM